MPMIEPGEFGKQRVIVFGDIIADIYEFGTIHRLSREAPIPVVEFDSERIVPGGSGNVAANVAALRGNACMLSFLGQDGPGEKVIQCLSEMGIGTQGIVTLPGLASTTKRRVIAQGLHTVKQQVLRVDRIPRKPVSEQELSLLWDEFVRLLPATDGVIISDYDLPLIPGRFFIEASTAAKNEGKKVIVDSRHRVLNYPGVTLIKPNRAEAEEVTGRSIGTPEKLADAGRFILDKTGVELLLITLGEEGMALFERDGGMHLMPAFNRLEVFDVSGAGDTVVAAVTMGLLAKMSPLQAVQFANVAAGLVVRKLGTATVSLDEVLDSLNQKETPQLGA